MADHHTSQRQLFESQPQWVEDDARRGTIATVVLPDGVEKPLDYQVPESLVPMVEPGRRVRVPLGRANRERIAKLLRFHSTQTAAQAALLVGKSTDQPIVPTVSLDGYLQRAVEGQTQVYYLSGPDLDALSRHPLLEAFRKRYLEVLFLDDPIDEFALTQLHRYDGKDLISIDSAEVTFPDSTNPVEDDSSKAKPNHFTRILELFRGALDGKVSDIRESSRLTDSPCCLINPQGTMSNQLQKVLSHTRKEYEAPKRIMEVNPHAGLIQRLCELSNNSDNDEFIRDCGQQLYANSLILDGLIPEVEGTTSRTLRFMEELARGKSAIIT